MIAALAVAVLASPARACSCVMSRVFPIVQPPDGTREVPIDVVPSVVFVGSGAYRGASQLGSELRLLGADGREVPITHRLEGTRVRMVPLDALAPSTEYRIQHLAWWTADGRRLADIERLPTEWPAGSFFAAPPPPPIGTSAWSDLARFATAEGSTAKAPLSVRIGSVDVETSDEFDGCGGTAYLDFTVRLDRPLAVWEYVELVERGRGTLVSGRPDDDTWSGRESNGVCQDEPGVFDLPADHDLVFEARVGGRRTEVVSAPYAVRTPPTGDRDAGLTPLTSVDLPAPPAGLPTWTPPRGGPCGDGLAAGSPEPAPALPGAPVLAAELWVEGGALVSTGATPYRVELATGAVIAAAADESRVAIATRRPVEPVTLQLFDRASGRLVREHSLNTDALDIAPSPSRGFTLVARGTQGRETDEFGIVVEPVEPGPRPTCGRGLTTARITAHGRLHCGGEALPGLHLADGVDRDGVAVGFLGPRRVVAWVDERRVWVGAGRAQVIAEDGAHPRLNCSQALCLVTWIDRFDVLYAATWRPDGVVSAPLEIDLLGDDAYEVQRGDGGWSVHFERRVWGDEQPPGWVTRQLTCATAPSLALPWSRPRARESNRGL